MPQPSETGDQRIGQPHAQAFVAGPRIQLLTAAQWSFWGNYLPRVFPLHLRGTGESFAINVGGRVLAPLAAIATPQLSNVLPGATPSVKLASSMALIAVTATVCALLLVRHLPEPAPELPED